MPIDPTDEAPPTMKIEMLPLGAMFPCSDRACELDASVTISVDKGDKRPWCTGHAHCEISVWMVGL
jgi:hypothetical protein